MVDCYNCKHQQTGCLHYRRKEIGFICDDFEFGVGQSAATGIAVGINKLLNWR